MLRRCVSLVRGIVNITPRLPPNHAQFYHKEVSNVQVSCSLGVIKEVIDNWIQIVGQKRAYFLAVRQPDKGERFLKLTERSGGHHTYISINLRFAFACLSNSLNWFDLTPSVTLVCSWKVLKTPQKEKKWTGHWVLTRVFQKYTFSKKNKCNPVRTPPVRTPPGYI